MIKLLKLLPYVLGIIAVIFLLGFLERCEEVDIKAQEMEQMQAEYNDTLKLIRADNQYLYRDVAALTDMNTTLDAVVKELNNIIFSKTKEIIDLKKIIGGGVGTIDSVVHIDSNCVGLILTFRDTTAFHTTFIQVEVKEDPEFYYELDIKPFGLTTYLVRDENGIWTGYAVPQEEFKDLINIDSLQVEISKDEFKEFYDVVDGFKLGFGVSLGSDFITQKTIYNVGIGVLLNERHAIGLDVSLNSDWYFANYKYYMF